MLIGGTITKNIRIALKIGQRIPINISSTLFFMLGGNVLWILGIMMCVGQSIGASLGARLAIKHGAKIIRPIVICVCFALSTQLLIREFF
ncbi:TSUP family transporter [Helicobacter rodentium]